MSQFPISKSRTSVIGSRGGRQGGTEEVLRDEEWGPAGQCRQGEQERMVANEKRKVILVSCFIGLPCAVIPGLSPDVPQSAPPPCRPTRAGSRLSSSALPSSARAST